MQAIHATTDSPSNDIFDRATELMRRLHDAIRDGRVQRTGCEEKRTLTGADISRTVCRLQNARRYYLEGELGAASFELAMAERSLTSMRQ
jgi:hypothetical protein